MATKKSESERELKRLGFVRVGAIKALILVSSVYEYAKKSSGPLRSTVGNVERAVNAVVGPVCDKFKGVPDLLLSFLDNKVDEAAHKFDQHAPPVAKKAMVTAQYFAHKTAEKAQRLISEAKTGGPWEALNYVAKESKQIVIDQTANLWFAVNKSSSVRPLAKKAAPAMAQWSEKYNSVVKGLTRKGYPAVGYLPLVPLDEISKAIEKKDGPPVESVESKSSSSDSD